MMAYAKVTQIVGNNLKVKLNGESEESSIRYYYLISYVPVVGDIVLVDEKLHVVIGKVVI